MARTYRDIAVEEMVRTVEEAMSQVIDWWGDLPAPMKEAIEQFRTQLGAAIDSVEFVKRALDRQVPENDQKTLLDLRVEIMRRIVETQKRLIGSANSKKIRQWRGIQRTGRYFVSLSRIPNRRRRALHARWHSWSL